MTTPEPTDLAALAQQVRYLTDRLAIVDCIHRHARGCDRHDIDLITSAYQAESVDEHGATVNNGPDYGAWANTAHAATSQVHTHNVTTHNCEIDGDIAHADSYVIVVLLASDGHTAQFISGRYLDRLERSTDGWRIALRRSTVECMFIADATVLQSSFFTDLGYIRGTRSHDDASYARPLTLQTPVERW
ncbi:MAG: nuclear transport factor 2 family protein [Frankiaceae bacterium]|nr:nuclear transport factor 2 family protein [Frankiaceae bacterium]MBV9871936.1 nuclear transport factor 2 family protein [Frankiaceae bacterium]